MKARQGRQPSEAANRAHSQLNVIGSPASPFTFTNYKPHYLRHQRLTVSKTRTFSWAQILHNSSIFIANILSDKLGYKHTVSRPICQVAYRANLFNCFLQLLVVVGASPAVRLQLKHCPLACWECQPPLALASYPRMSTLYPSHMARSSR